MTTRARPIKLRFFSQCAQEGLEEGTGCEMNEIEDLHCAAVLCSDGNTGGLLMLLYLVL